MWLAGLVGWAPGALGAGVAYLSADSFSYSEPVPLRAYFNDWRTPFSGGDDGYTYNWLEAGAALGAWRLGVLARYDYYTRYSAETAEFYHRIQNRQALDIGRTYHLDLEVEHFSAAGCAGPIAGRRGRAPGSNWG